MSMAAILFNGAKLFEQIVNILSTEGSMWNLMKTVQAVSEKKTFKEFHNFIHVHSPGARANNPQNFDSRLKVLLF